MRGYTANKYIDVTETKPDPILKKHMEVENEVIFNVENAKDKTFVDLGAGHGRLTKMLAEIARNVISIELNEDMLPELRKRSNAFQNTKVVHGDITTLDSLLKQENVKQPILLLVQNTLGTIEGDWKKALSEMKKVADENKGEIVISFFRQQALGKWGIELYSSIAHMTGEPDLEKTDIEKGIFVSKTGYVSKWRTDEEIGKIKKYFGGEVINEIWSDNWCVIHLSLDN